MDIVLLPLQAYNQHCVVSDGLGITMATEANNEAGDLYLVPGQIKVHTFSFLPQGEDVGKLLEVNILCDVIMYRNKHDQQALKLHHMYPAR